MLPPAEGEEGTSWYRYMERHGPRVHNLAFYVRHIEKTVETLEQRAGTKRDGPLTLTDGPAAGQSINYFATPFGTDGNPPPPVRTSRSSGRSRRTSVNASSSRTWFLCGHDRAG